MSEAARPAVTGPVERGIRRRVTERAVSDSEWPRYFVEHSGEWAFCGSPGSKQDRANPCGLCGWNRHMGVHQVPAGTRPSGAHGLHSWVPRETPNVGVEPPKVGSNDGLGRIG